MNDITFDACTCGSVVVSDAQAVAALKSDNERLRVALEKIVRPGGADDFWQCYDIARATLDGQPAPEKEEA